ncbi:MAG TPA: ABC transporter substrate-binding protein [Chloroflexia bacterium]|nr:ABC transporter substrate-binding protein [Chloroflexia bacterium]
MLTKRRFSILTVISLFTMLLLAACGPSADTPVPATPATTAAATSAATSAAATTAAGSGSGASTAASGSGSDIRIGLMGPFTGPSAGLGLGIKRGAQMAVDDINKAGGINGRKIVLIERDDKATPSEGVTNARDLIEKEKVLALFGTANTAVGVAQAPIIQQSKIPWVVPVTTGTKITQEPGNPSYIFRISMTDVYQTAYVADFAINKYKKIALIHDDSGYGTLGRDDLLKSFKNRNVEPVLIESYKVGGTADDMKPMLNKIKAAAPDAIVNWGLGAEAANIKKAMKDLNIDTPMIGSWGLSMPNYPQLANGLEAGTIVAQTFSVDTTDQKQLDFINRYKSEYKTDRVDFPSGLAQSYDGMHLLAEALKQPGAADNRDTLRTALENVSGYDGIIKKYDKPWANQYHEAFTDKDFFITVWKDGKMVKLDNK